MYINSGLKRTFDLIGFSVSLFVFGPLFVIIAITIVINDRKSIFFIQDRIGKHEKKFKVYKFRTMEHGQVTRVGRWLRKTGLDELPQYINILRGEMSIVGPRPLTEETISEALLTGEIPPPDLIIRTGNEKRISNFYLWQAAYSEIYFHSKLWPNFQIHDLIDCIEKFKNSERRFGKIG